MRDGQNHRRIVDRMPLELGRRVKRGSGTLGQYDLEGLTGLPFLVPHDPFK